MEYVNNKELEKELVLFSDSYKFEIKRLIKEEGMKKKEASKKARGHISDELGEMFMMIANNLINKNNFNNYTYRDEMIGLGIEYLCRFARNYTKKKENHNAFAYCTKICYHGFVQVIIKERKKSKMKDTLIREASYESELEKWVGRDED